MQITKTPGLHCIRLADSKKPWTSRHIYLYCTPLRLNIQVLVLYSRKSREISMRQIEHLTKTRSWHTVLAASVCCRPGLLALREALISSWSTRQECWTRSAAPLWEWRNMQAAYRQPLAPHITASAMAASLQFRPTLSSLLQQAMLHSARLQLWSRCLNLHACLYERIPNADEATVEPTTHLQ